MMSVRNKRLARWTSWRGAAGLCAVAAMSGWLAFYIRDSVRATNEMRARAESAHCMEAAIIYAAELEHEWNADLRSLRSIAAQPAIIAAVNGRDLGAACTWMKIALAGGPAMSSLSIYNSGGRRGLSIWDASPDEPDRMSIDSLRYISRSGMSMTQEDRSLLLVVPVKAPNTEGYLVARWAPSLPAWKTATLVTTDAVLLVADRSGVAVLGENNVHETEFHVGPEFEPVRRARTRSSGMLTLFEPEVPKRMLVGYAVANQAGLVAMVFVPSETALASSRYLVRRVAYIVVPAFALFFVAVWAIGTYYYKQQRLSLQLLKHNTRLREVNRAKSDFLANVSHDLRTPLASLRVCLSSLQDPDLPWNEEQARSFLQVASEQADHLSARVRNLLDMARIESNSHALNTETCDLTDIAASAIDTIASLLNGRKILADFPREPLFVECDQVQVATVILNLLENALKYSPAGTPIAIKGVADNPYVTLSISDAGPGVAATDESRVFDKFYRSPSVASIGGTGLGLAIGRSIIEQHGGRIGVRQGDLGGAEFWFSLPAPLIDMAFCNAKGTDY